MATVPYPSFHGMKPVDRNDNRIALSAVGRCRFNPSSIENNTTTNNNNKDYRLIVEKNIEQANVVNDDEESNKKLKKKYMKQGVAMATEYLLNTLELDISIIDVEVVVNPNDIIITNGCLAACLLDAGCNAIVIPYDMKKIINNNNDSNIVLDCAQIPSERLMVDFGIYDSNTQSIEMIQTAIDHVKEYCCCISIHITSITDINEETILKLLSLGTEQVKVVIEMNYNNYCSGTNNDDTEENNVNNEITTTKTMNEFAILISKCCTAVKECKFKRGIALINPNASLLGLCYANCIKTDRIDQLYTTIVCTRSGVALGLVYSNILSIITSLQCGKGVYYSRSRSSLWRKGDTSGHYQSLHRIDLDCDGDAIRFTVTQCCPSYNIDNHKNSAEQQQQQLQLPQEPAFCHLNTLTCWGKPCGIYHLQETLRQRYYNAPIGSYTKRLFDDDILLRNKLIEEVQELTEANTKQHVTEELADVLYFAMTYATKYNVTIDDAVIELDKRTKKVTRRPGNSKDYRIKDGDAIIQQLQNNNNEKDKK